MDCCRPRRDTDRRRCALASRSAPGSRAVYRGGGGGRRPVDGIAQTVRGGRDNTGFDESVCGSAGVLGAGARTGYDSRRPRVGGLTASGYVVARRKATIAAEITGKVTEVLVDEGMTVKAGQVLARIKSRLTETDLALAESRAKAAEAAANATAAELRDAERIHERTLSLAKKSFASEADMTRTEARVAVLRAQLEQARAQVETANLQARRVREVLDQHSVRAPFGGVVIERSAQAGEMISPLSAGGSYTRTGICTIVDMDSLEVEVDVNEAFIGRVHEGGAVEAVLDAYPDWTIPAYVIAIVPTANREKATVRVRIGFREKDPRILPDMAVKVTFLDDNRLSGEKTSSAQ
ncbi:MAG: efflux RND transporter periplasmic adaptor subunit [Xanthobacteraceae bacterium]